MIMWYTRLFLVFFFMCATSYLVPAQDAFPQRVFYESFKADSGLWEIRSDASALYLIQNGEYLLRRLDHSEAAVLCPKAPPCEPYKLQVSIKLDDGGGIHYGGIAFMMQDDNSGGFLLEVNTKKQFRVRQVIQGSFRLLTGTAKSQGWMAGNVEPAGKPNVLSIVYSDKSYELYVNHTKVKAFVEPAYKMGRFGFVTGPLATVHADEVSIWAGSGCNQREALGFPPVDPHADSLSVIQRLQEEVKRLKAELRSLRDSLRQAHQ